MALDDAVVDQRRFARLLGLADDRGAGLPVGPTGDSRRRTGGDSEERGPNQPLADDGAAPGRSIPAEKRHSADPAALAGRGRRPDCESDGDRSRS